ncbi:MAG: tetratricopeptide repeat protein, partial [Granulosicoccus sp.]|nr:tetratricopeptide repeat protein [Granulosicoccus sp.]
DLAFDWSEKALALDPDDIRSLMLRAKIEQRKEHWEEALRLWKRVNKARGEHYESELQIALCYLKMGNHADALESTEESLKRHDRVSSFLQIKYKALLRLDRRDEALAVIEELLASDLHNNDFLLEKARVCLQLGKLDQSEDACKVALEKEPDNVQLLTLYARIGQKRVNYNAAA